MNQENSVWIRLDLTNGRQRFVKERRISNISYDLDVQLYTVDIDGISKYEDVVNIHYPPYPKMKRTREDGDWDY